MTNAAIYARESSSDTTKAPPIAEQIARGKQWAEQQGFTIVQVYEDDGFSGGDWTRPSWNRCILDVKRHLFKELYVWNQDRIARDTEQFLFFYRSVTNAHGRIYEDTSQGYIDMESLGGRVKHQTLAQAAEIFRLVTGDKVKQAYLRMKDKSKWGRPQIPLDMPRIHTLRAEGKGWRAIAKETGVSHNTIRNAVFKNRVIVEQPTNDGDSHTETPKKEDGVF